MYYIYILLLSNHTLYKGYTADLKQRINRHKNGQVESTSKYLPINKSTYF